MTLRAIETRYKGYRFRSRLEARWAVFLDDLMVCRWDYEPQGYELPSGRYLPDFLLQAGTADECWLEIKPVCGSEGDPRWRELRAQSGRPFFVGVGMPIDGLFEVCPITGALYPASLRISVVDYRLRIIADESAGFVESAKRAARSARFEFGESGAL